MVVRPGSGPGSNALVLRKGTYYTDQIELQKQHSGLTIQNYKGERATISGGVPLSLKASDWSPYKDNTWVVDISKADPAADKILVGDSAFKGLRLAGKRAVRAKYPNGDPELAGQWFESKDARMGGGEYVEGWVKMNQSTSWIKPDRREGTEEIISRANDWPSVYWPTQEVGGSTWTGEGDWVTLTPTPTPTIDNRVVTPSLKP